MQHPTGEADQMISLLAVTLLAQVSILPNREPGFSLYTIENRGVETASISVDGQSIHLRAAWRAVTPDHVVDLPAGTTLLLVPAWEPADRIPVVTGGPGVLLPDSNDSLGEIRMATAGEIRAAFGTPWASSPSCDVTPADGDTAMAALTKKIWSQGAAS